jgi:uncharacterized protein
MAFIPRRRPILAAAVLSVVTGLAIWPVVAGADASSMVFINEIHYDNDGTDTGEFIEIAGPAGTDLSGWSLVLYNGANGAVYDTQPLSGTAPDQQGGYGTAAVDYPTNGIQNGSPDGVALVHAGAVEQFLSYEGTFVAVGGPADGLTSDDIGVAETPSTPGGFSLQLGGAGSRYGNFTWQPPATATPGEPNTGQTFGGGGSPSPTPSPTSPGAACGEPGTSTINQIQGSGPTFDTAHGGTQTIEGVVTDALLGGVQVQEESADADGDPATSDGIFVYLSADRSAPAVGSVARITGTVTEFGEMTELTNVTALTDCGPASEPIAPTDVTFPLPSLTGLERYEGMLVRFPQSLVISEYFEYDRFGEVVAALPPNGWDRLYTPTAVVDPGPDATALAEEYAKRTVRIDDRSTAQNPSSIPHPGNGQPFSLDNRFRGGDTVTGIVGSLQQAFGSYRLEPTQYGSYLAKNPRPATPPSVGGDVRVGSANVLNYFLTLDAGGKRCGPDRDQDCRGADTSAERDRQRAKIIAELVKLDADVVGLIEMENTPGVEPAKDLVDGLNAELGAGTYGYIDTGVIGTDAIRVGLLYKPAVVRPAGAYDVLDSSDDPRFADTKNRPMLSQTFDTVADGSRLTVSVNHLKSKGSDCNDLGDPDTGDGQANCNVTRTNAVEAIIDHLKTDPTHSGDPDNVIIGDLNSYDHEDPITAFTEAGYVDEIKRFGGEFAYSYVFDGQNGYLDHGLANPSLTRQVTGAADFHNNADEPDILDYDMTFKPPAIDAIFAPDAYRASDHDPVLVGLAPIPASADTCYAGVAQTVETFDQRRRANGSAVPKPFSDPAQSLGRSTGSNKQDATTLGIGGRLVQAFAHPVQNNNGSAPDLRFVDISDSGNDVATVYATADGVSWVKIGTVSGTGTVDLGDLPSATAIKVVDETTGKGSVDGYDLDAVQVLTGCVDG